MFSSQSSYIRMEGDLAIAYETAVADHQVNHVCNDCYMLWWDDLKIAHWETIRPPVQSDLAASKWGIGSLFFVDANSVTDAIPRVDERTVIAVDPEKKLVWIACFDYASHRVVGRKMAELGAKVIMTVDGGTSMAMSIGADAKNVRPGTVTGNWRPVANQFGFRALPLP